MNLYAFVKNNPINHIDQYGLFWEDPLQGFYDWKKDFNAWDKEPSGKILDCVTDCAFGIAKRFTSGGYLLGLGEIALGGAIIAGGGALEIATCGGFTFGLGLTTGTGALLIGHGLILTTQHAQDISFDSKSSFFDSIYKSGSVDPSLPINPDDLLKRPDWKETTHPDAKEGGHRTFENKETGERLRHDEAKPGASGHRGESHWHRFNPNSKNRFDEYLDANNIPVPRNSPESHLYPNKIKGI